MDKLTYEQRRLELATIFDSMENADEYNIAEVTIAAQAEAIKEALNDDNQRGAYIADYLIENGYVPAPELNTCSICGGEYKIINCASFCEKCGRERN